MTPNCTHQEICCELPDRFEKAIGRSLDSKDSAWALAVMTRQAIGNSENTRLRIELGIHWLLHNIWREQGK